MAGLISREESYYLAWGSSSGGSGRETEPRGLSLPRNSQKTYLRPKSLGLARIVISFRLAFFGLGLFGSQSPTIVLNGEAGDWPIVCIGEGEGDNIS